MIKVSVLYPFAAGCRFDLDYYCNRHMPLVKERLGAARAESLARGPYLSLSPAVHGSDGFFAAILQRSA